MSVVGNSKLVFEKRYNDAYNMIIKEYDLHYKKDYGKVLSILDGLIEKNNTFLTQIYNEQNSLINYEKLLEKRDIIFKKMEDEVVKNTNLNMEKDTFVMLSKEKNKNIEIYYIVYILFSVLLLLIEGSVVLFK
tara:strand:+ start:930 stop:1328 length:399 start_codon:yes stop_codon:yes gene_type:complete